VSETVARTGRGSLEGMEQRLNIGLMARAGTLLSSRGFILALVAAGIALRLLQYLANRSLWLDELRLTLNILERSYAGLTSPLDYNQGAPIGFLLLVKASTELFGRSEYALRLVPFIFGIVSVLLFYRVARDFIVPSAVPLAVALFAILPPLVYYSSEVKQYSGDVMATLLLLGMARPFAAARAYAIPRALLLALVGAVTLWISHAAVFTLAGIGVVILLPSFVRGDPRSRLAVPLVAGIWMLSLTAFYQVSLRHIASNQMLLQYWNQDFVPLSLSVSTAKWLVTHVADLFADPAHFRPPGVAMFAFAVGCAVAFLRNRSRFWLMISPLAFAFLAAALQKYPFGGRLLLFAVPLLILLVAEGAAIVAGITWDRAPAIAVILVGLLVFYPATEALESAVAPKGREEIKPVLAYVMAHRRDGDELYLYGPARFAFQYYAVMGGWKLPVMVGVDMQATEYSTLGDDLERLRGRGRMWVIFSHIRGDEDKFSLFYLDRIGHRTDAFNAQGAAAYLYDFREGPQGTVGR